MRSGCRDGDTQRQREAQRGDQEVERRRGRVKAVTVYTAGWAGRRVPGGAVLQRLPCQHTGQSCPPSQGKRLCCPGPWPGSPSPAGKQRLPGDWNGLSGAPGKPGPRVPPKGPPGGVMPQQLILGTSAAPHPSCVPQAETGLKGLRTGEVALSSSHTPGNASAACWRPCTAGPGKSRLGLILLGWLTRQWVSSSFMEQWFFERTARGHSLAETGWLEACGLTVSRQMTDKVQDSSPSPGGDGPLPPSGPSAGGPWGWRAARESEASPILRVGRVGEPEGRGVAVRRPGWGALLQGWGRAGGALTTSQHPPCSIVPGT